MSSYTVIASTSFENDLDAAVAWRLINVGRISAMRLLGAYDDLVPLIGTFPLLGGCVEGTHYRWRALERYVVIYHVNEDARTVTLLRLFHMSADWRVRLLGDENKELPENRE